MSYITPRCYASTFATARHQSPTRRTSIRKPVTFLAALAAAGCAAGHDPVDTFDPDVLVRGATMSREECRDPATSVWVTVEGRGECIRYFHAGLAAPNPLVHVWFHGDRLARIRGGSLSALGYRDNSPEKLEEQARAEFKARGIPFIRLSRPGTYGSSGDHSQRRRPRDIAVIDAALDAIKQKHAIERFALSGQSGGGHVVASLLTRRRDVGCAVITSGVVAVAERNHIKGWSKDITGYDDFFDPIAHVRDIAKDGRRIFIVADPEDALVPFATAVSYQRALAEAGHDARLIRARGTDQNRHALAPVGHKIVKWCVDGVPTGRIVEQATTPGLGG